MKEFADLNYNYYRQRLCKTFKSNKNNFCVESSKQFLRNETKIFIYCDKAILSSVSRHN